MPRPPRAKRLPLPDFIQPQLAQLVTVAPDGPDWLHEIKSDVYPFEGVREDKPARDMVQALEA